MVFSGQYFLTFLKSDHSLYEKKYEVEFFVDLDACESPGAHLRRIAFQAFESSFANGLSIKGCFPIQGVL